MERFPQTSQTPEMPEAAAQNSVEQNFAWNALAELAENNRQDIQTETSSEDDGRQEYVDEEETDKKAEQEKSAEIDLLKEFTEAKALANEVSRVEGYINDADVVNFLIESGLEAASKTYGAKKVMDAAVKGLDNFTRERKNGNGENSFRKDIDRTISGIYKEIEPDAEARKQFFAHQMDRLRMALIGGDKNAKHFVISGASIDDAGEVKLLRSGSSGQLLQLGAYDALMYLSKMNKAVNDPDSKIFGDVTMDDFVDDSEDLNNALHKIQEHVAEAADDARDSFRRIELEIDARLDTFRESITPDSKDLREAQRIIASLNFADQDVSDAAIDFENRLHDIEKERDEVVEAQVKQKELELYESMNSSKEEVKELAQKMDGIIAHKDFKPLDY